MEYTENFNLKKPEPTDPYDIGNENENMDIIDAKIKEMSESASGGSIVKVTTEDAGLYGQDVTITDGTTTIGGQFSAEGVCTFKSVTMTGTLTVSSTDGAKMAVNTINIPYYGSYTVSLALWGATINLTTDDFAGQSIVVTQDGTDVATITFDSTGAATYIAPAVGEYIFSVTSGGKTYSESVNVTEETTYSVSINALAIVTWADGTDDEIAAMIQAAHDGDINLYDCGWRVGDVRTITVSAFQGAKNSHAEQQVDITISSFSNYENCGNVLQFDFVDSLAEYEDMNESNTNVGGYAASRMYKTTLPAMVNALPTWLKNALITFSVKASAGNQSSSIETVSNNKLALRSEVEIFGTTTYSAAGEGSQIPYYETSGNRIKKLGHNGSASYWWERSPRVSNATHFCRVGSNGGASSDNASNNRGLAPFGCI